MTIEAIAWDMDGTLIDSEPLHHRALLAGTQSLGADLSDIDGEEFRGRHMHDVWTAVRPRLPADVAMGDWLDAIHDHYRANMAGLAPIPGALAASEAIASLGLTQVCVSNSARVIVDANIAALGMRRRLAFSLSIDDVMRGKPDPEPYLAAARKLGLDPARMVAVEDSLAGAQAARAAGMIVVGYHGQRVPFADLDHVVADHGELVTIIRRRLDGPAPRHGRTFSTPPGRDGPASGNPIAAPFSEEMS